jgi:hypothetical protein
MDLTHSEQDLFKRLPRPPQNGSIQRPTIIWILEWLSPDDQRTGDLLQKWIQERCHFGSKYFACKSKKEVISTIERATLFADSETIPLLHIEAHGDIDGLTGPAKSGNLESLNWEELISPLQKLNLHTRCNLVVFIAACSGFAAITGVFKKGPRAPAVALVGPIATIHEGNLLHGTKEFYRRLNDRQPNLNEMVECASLEAGQTAFELEPFVVLAFEALAERIIVSKRPQQIRLTLERMRQRMSEETPFSETEIELRLANMFPPPLDKRMKEQQSAWDTLFMVDLFPDNQERFSVDWSTVIDMIEKGS